MSDRKSIEVAIILLRNKKEIMIGYLNHKACDHDWHGVSDAANDIREIEAKLEVLVKVIE